MECPKCKYEPTMAEHTASPEICPKCGVVYAKVQARQDASVADSPGVSAKLGAGIAGAKAGIEESRQRRQEAEWQSSLKRAAPDCVVITGVQIPFISLIWLMTKIILAALPAAVLAGLILFMLGSFVGGVFSGLGNYSSNDVPSLSSGVSGSSDELRRSDPETVDELPDRREVAEQCRKYEGFAETLMQGRQAGIPMSTAMGSGENELLNHLVVSAYEKPRYGTDQMQQREVEDFKNEVYLQCIKNMR
jgi:hypothetical protein